MAQYSRTVLTDAGVILARRMMDETITMEFTRIVTGDGQYSSGEDIAARTALKSQKQSFPLSSRSLTDEDRVLHLKYVISNVNPDSSPLTVGYYVREVGIYAHVTGESEILYAVAIADADAADYLPEYDELQPSTITMDWFITVGNTENITIQASPSAYALAEDLADLAEVVDQKLDANGDSKNNTVTFTSSDAADSDVTKSTGWDTVAPLASGETHASFMTKFSKMIKNLRWIYKLLGTTDISSIGDGTVTKALSVLNAKLIFSEITLSGALRAWKLYVNPSLTVVFCTVSIQTAIEFNGHLSYIMSAMAHGTSINNMATVSTVLDSHTRISIDPNRGSATKYEAWLIVVGTPV